MPGNLLGRADLQIRIEQQIHLHGERLLEEVAVDVGDALDFRKFREDAANVLLDLRLGSHQLHLHLLQILLGINMHQHLVDFRDFVEDSPTHALGDLVGGGNGHQSIHLDVQVHQQVRPHRACPDLMEMLHAFDLCHLPVDAFQHGIIGGFVRQFPQAFVPQLHRDAQDQSSNEKPGDGVHQWKPELRRTDARKCRD